MQVFDRRVIDSTGAFLNGELERLDPKLHMPLTSVFYTRDIDLREDITIADDVSSFTVSSFAGTGGMTTTGKSWISREANAVPGVSIDIAKTPHQLYLWGKEVKWTIPELEAAQKLGRPIDAQKLEALKILHEMESDEMAYVGDGDMDTVGLVNNDAVVIPAAVPAGVSGSTSWAQKTPDEILADLNEALTSAWSQAAWAKTPNRVLMPPLQFGYVATTKVSSAGDRSILRYLMENNVVAQQQGELEIYPSKWLIGRGVGGTPKVEGTVDRFVTYHKDQDVVRFPKTALARTPVTYNSIWQSTTYFGKMGGVEFVYPETVVYRDGI
jgi:hypothetical protein